MEIDKPEGRAPDGRWLQGYAPNPTGKNGQLKGWQPIGLRLQKWLEMSAVEVAGMNGDEVSLQKLSMIDAYCIKFIATGFSAAPKDMVKIFKEINDRIEGTPRQTITIANPRPDMPETVKEMTDEEINTHFRNLLFMP